MKYRERPSKDMYDRMDMAVACVMGSFFTTVFWAVCTLMGVFG